MSQVPDTPNILAAFPKSLFCPSSRQNTFWSVSWSQCLSCTAIDKGHREWNVIQSVTADTKAKMNSRGNLFFPQFAFQKKWLIQHRKSSLLRDHCWAVSLEAEWAPSRAFNSTQQKVTVEIIQLLPPYFLAPSTIMHHRFPHSDKQKHSNYLSFFFPHCILVCSKQTDRKYSFSSGKLPEMEAACLGKYISFKNGIICLSCFPDEIK